MVDHWWKPFPHVKLFHNRTVATSSFFTKQALKPYLLYSCDCFIYYHSFTLKFRPNPKLYKIHLPCLFSTTVFSSFLLFNYISSYFFQLISPLSTFSFFFHLAIFHPFHSLNSFLLIFHLQLSWITFIYLFLYQTSLIPENSYSYSGYYFNYNLSLYFFFFPSICTTIYTPLTSIPTFSSFKIIFSLGILFFYLR